MEALTEYQRANALIDAYNAFILQAWGAATRKTTPYKGGHSTIYTGIDGTRLGYDEIIENFTRLDYFLPAALEIKPQHKSPGAIDEILVEELDYTQQDSLLRRTVILVCGNSDNDEIRLSTIRNNNEERTEAFAFGVELTTPESRAFVFRLHEAVIGMLMPATISDTNSIAEE